MHLFINLTECVGLEGIVRNSKGDWVLGFCKTSYANGSMASELQPIHEGLKFVQDQNLVIAKRLCRLLRKRRMLTSIVI